MVLEIFAVRERERRGVRLTLLERRIFFSMYSYNASENQLGYQWLEQLLEPSMFEQTFRLEPSTYHGCDTIVSVMPTIMSRTRLDEPHPLTVGIRRLAVLSVQQVRQGGERLHTDLSTLKNPPTRKSP